MPTYHVRHTVCVWHWVDINILPFSKCTLQIEYISFYYIYLPLTTSTTSSSVRRHISQRNHFISHAPTSWLSFSQPTSAFLSIPWLRLRLTCLVLPSLASQGERVCTRIVHVFRLQQPQQQQQQQPYQHQQYFCY